VSDSDIPQTPGEAEVLADEQAAPAELAEQEPAPEEDKTEYIEFVGQPPYGTEFYKGELGTHTVFAHDFKKYHDLELGKKEVVWRKGSNGRMLVPVSDITPEAAEYLASDPMFKRVTL
jgi:hypothetical protein